MNLLLDALRLGRDMTLLSLASQGYRDLRKGRQEAFDKGEYLPIDYLISFFCVWQIASVLVRFVRFVHRTVGWI